MNTYLLFLPPAIAYPPPVKVRLSGTPYPYMGRVEVFYKGLWGAVCDDFWKLRHGHVVCRMLGYERAERVSCCSKYGWSTSRKIWLDDVRCNGNERTLMDCRRRKAGMHNCNNKETAGVVCQIAIKKELTTTSPTAATGASSWKKSILKGKSKLPAAVK